MPCEKMNTATSIRDRRATETGGVARCISAEATTPYYGVTDVLAPAMWRVGDGPVDPCLVYACITITTQQPNESKRMSSPRLRLCTSSVFSTPAREQHNCCAEQLAIVTRAHTMTDKDNSCTITKTERTAMECATVQVSFVAWCC